MPVLLGLGVAVAAAVMFTDAWRSHHDGVVAQVAAVEEVAAQRGSRETAVLGARLAAAAEAARDAVVRQVLTAPEDDAALDDLMRQLAVGWPVVAVAIEKESPPDAPAAGDAALSRCRWPVVASVPELGEVVVTIDTSVVAQLRGEQEQRMVRTVAAIERAAEQAASRQHLGFGVGALLSVGLAWWCGARWRRRAPPVVVEVPTGNGFAEAAQAEFLAMISHELRTPLNAVLGASELLRTTALDPEQAELVSASDLSGRQLLSLVDGLLDLAELESGQLRVAAQVFDLELELEGVVQVFLQAAQAKGLGLELEVDDGFPDVAVGDPARFREVLAALLSNAIKFTSSGTVRLTASCVGGAADTLRLEIHDTGDGIDPAALERVFRRFEQGRRDRTRQVGGAGVGLTIARGLVQSMGGRIGADSVLGRGSTFWFELPNHRPSELQRHEFEATLPLRGRRLLLLTGSEELAARVTGQLLSQGCEVSMFSPARASDLAAAPDLGWDCAVVDADVAMRIGDAWGQLKLPAIVLGNRRELRGGEFVRLPVRKGELLEAVQRVCDRRASAQECRVRRRVLVAEDNAVNRRMIEKMLEVAGCEVVLTTDGVEAVRAWREGAFDLVLMDYQMPGLDGPQTARRIRTLPGGADVPIVAFTANSGGDVRDACVAAGMNGFLAKPLRFADLEQVLQRWAPCPDRADTGLTLGEVAGA